jgi:hypothetical protein
MAFRQDARAKCKMVDMEVARRSEHLLHKHRAQTPMGSQQQPVHTAKPNWHRAKRIPFKTKPKTTWENSMQLLQAGLKREQERGLRYQGFDVCIQPPLHYGFPISLRAVEGASSA